ncbi:disease resistance protein RPV1-like isoform X4 [Quercus robur]|uniref:disease resistance protein RPV1-like isoform X4 n=1 Tax=Quercus robur TaxID=38942 RepID=UPI002162D670|nr:disease resistance protein RPV1-like isoform X4 [Quercus robur]
MALVTTKGASSSSSSFTHQPKNFNVFLSFRGEDTRFGFVSHLYHALCLQGIHTFIDNDLERGEEISTELLKTIENSTLSVIIFSENYASSAWCLDELAKIIECWENIQSVLPTFYKVDSYGVRKSVLPIFYKVDPSKVRKQQGKFGEALTRHEENFNDKEKVQRWRKALLKAGGISGWHCNNSSNECELIQEIVKEISKSKLNQMELHVAKYPVGIKSRAEALITHLYIESNEDIHMVAIYGLGGVGKTTIAKDIYNKISHHFKAKVFLENVRERSQTNEGIICLQKILLSKILGSRNLEVCNVSIGITMINECLCQKRVLIILDDVDNLDQIEKMLGKCDQFAAGSRIIMTTRNKRLLGTLGNGISTYEYEVKELNENEAIELFSKHAFQSNKPNGDYLELAHKVIHYAKGLPLALVVMGADLYRRPKLEWESALKKYEKIPNGDIQKILKISYDGLDENEQNIFLDIACFFKGYCMNYDKVVAILEGCDLEPVDGISRLIDKCLVTGDHYNELSMHDLLQRMGREIVRQESPQNPGERSRLWHCEDVLEVLTENTGSDIIQSIRLDPSEPIELQLNAQIFRKMKNLRLLTIHNVRCQGHLEYLPNGLNLLDWPEYPFPLLPSHFSPKNLVVLNMAGNQLEKTFKQVFAFKTLSYVDFSRCESILKIPDLSMSPNIKELKLVYCKNLVKIDDSVGRLDKLELWDLTGCKKLETLPSCLSMKSLRSFNLDSCRSLKMFPPNISQEMKSLKRLHLYGTGISELPQSFGNLTGITDLVLGYWAVRLHLPGSIYNLQCLQILYLIGDFTFPKDEEPLCNSYGGFSKYVFPSLNSLFFSDFSNLSEMEFILNYCCPPTLGELYINGSNIVNLPKSIDRFQSLEFLEIARCYGLEEIPRFPQSVRYVSAPAREILVQIPEILRLPPNIPPCLGVSSHMLIGPHPHSSSTISPVSVPEKYVFLSDYNFVVDLLGDEIIEIPNWLNHQRNGNSISFFIGPEIPTITLCLCVEIKMIAYDIYDVNYHAVISINGCERLFESSCFSNKYGAQLVFCCRLQSSLQILFEDLNLGDRNLVQIFCEASNDTGKIVSEIKRVGVHVECICSPQKSQKVSKKRNWPLESRICTCLCLAQTHCQCPKQLCSTYSTGPTSVHSGYSDNCIISSAMDGGGSSSISLSSNSGLSMDVTNGSEFDFGFQSTLGDGFDMGSSSLIDDSDFSPYP